MSRLVAVVARGLEEVAAKEIRSLGGGIGKTRKDRGRVWFEGPPDAVYRANLALRSVERVLVPVGPPITARSVLDLTRAARELPWERWVSGERPVRVVASAKACRLYHSGAIEDAMREALGYRGLRPPDAAEAGASGGVTLDVRGTADRWTLAVDSSGPSLHRRGYRKASATAPVKETLAAACLLATGWTGDTEFLDPMCGSGTFVAEAALLAARRPPGLDREFAFSDWASFDESLFRSAVGRLAERCRAPSSPLEGGDAAPGAVKAARANLARLGVEGVLVSKRRLQDTPASGSPGLVLVNPPYGKRVAPGRALDAAKGEWRAWAKTLRERRPKAAIYALSPEQILAEAAGAIGRPVLRFSNGGIPVALVRLQ